MHDLSKKESPNMNRKLIILLLDSGNYAKKGNKYLCIYLFVREIITLRFALMALIMGH